jgi:hypothetical protein
VGQFSGDGGSAAAVLSLDGDETKHRAPIIVLRQDAEKVAKKRSPQALKRGRIFNDLTARVNSCPSRSLRFTAN